jgi:hypothetical protein
MSKRMCVYAVHYTAVIHGTAYYTIPEEEKLKHFLDGSADIDWKLDSIEREEVCDTEIIDTIDEDETEEVPTFGPEDEFPF